MPPLGFWHNFIIDPDTDCWLWTGSLRKDGYGSANAQGQSNAHRLSWVLHRGPIPDGMTIDHLCRTRRCVNPQHLEVVSHSENVRRAVASRETCGNGHPWSLETTAFRKSGRRDCMTCRDEYNRSYYLANRDRLIAASRRQKQEARHK